MSIGKEDKCTELRAKNYIQQKFRLVCEFGVLSRSEYCSVLKSKELFGAENYVQKMRNEVNCTGNVNGRSLLAKAFMDDEKLPFQSQSNLAC